MNQLIFPKNITGFHNLNKPAPSQIGLERFKAICITIKAVGDFDLIQFFDYSEQGNKSYHLQLIEKEGNAYFIFLNKYASFIAFSEILEENWQSWNGEGELPKNRYIDFPQLTKYFQTDFQIIPQEILLLPIDADNPKSAEVVQNLEDAEFAEFSYFAPQCLGNIVFNNWRK
ncbi:MAG: hypothetical protein ACI85I_000026 [Arenicella sp.]|jgi:hypothetical protein